MDPARVLLEHLDADPHALLAELRSERPVAWVDALGGWLVTSRDLAVAVMRDAVAFTVDDPRFSTAQVVGTSMLSLDGAEHERHRAPFVDALRPTEIATAHAGRIDATAESLVRSIRSRRSADLRTQLAGPLAVQVAASVLGLDDVAPEDLLAHYAAIVAAVDRVSRGDDIDAAARHAVGALADMVHLAGADPHTLVGAAAATLNPDEVVSNSAVFLFGGIETSEAMTANVLFHLLSNPDQWQLVLDDASLIDNAVEESLRLEPAASRVDRYATLDITLASAHITAGDLVMVSLAAANRDPTTFTDPDRFDVRRANARQHLAFATGPHACLGAQLARLQTRAAVRAVREHLRGVHLTAATAPRGVIFRKPPAVLAAWD
jgi:cytochrome P450